MELVILLISNRDQLNGRQEERGGLEANPFTNGIWDLLLSMCAGRNKSPKGRRDGYDDLQACQT